MRKLLFLSPVFPFPGDNGQRVRIANILRACAEDFAVTFIGPPPENENMRLSMENICTRIVYVKEHHIEVPIFQHIKVCIKLKEWIDSSRATSIKNFGEALSEEVLQTYALIWVERRDLLSLVGSHIKRTIVDLDDLEHLKKFRELMFRQTINAKARGLPRVLGLMLGEVRDSQRTLASVVCSDEDCIYLKRRGGTKAIVIRNGTDIQFDGNFSSFRSRAGKAVFVGNMAYPPNVDAVRYFEKEIMPLVIKDFPAFKLEVIGVRPETDVRSSFSDLVNFCGFVPDLGTALAAYSLFVAPIRSGGGTKLKLLDAMASGIPVVTTSVGAEGLKIEHLKHALICDDAFDFAQAVRSLLSQKDLSLNLVHSALDLVRNHFTWQNIRLNIRSHLAGLSSKQSF